MRCSSQGVAHKKRRRRKCSIIPLCLAPQYTMCCSGGPALAGKRGKLTASIQGLYGLLKQIGKSQNVGVYTRGSVGAGSRGVSLVVGIRVEES
jgi:hypothetical protein